MYFWWVEVIIYCELREKVSSLDESLRGGANVVFFEDSIEEIKQPHSIEDDVVIIGFRLVGEINNRARR